MLDPTYHDSLAIEDVQLSKTKFIFKMQSVAQKILIASVFMIKSVF